MEWVALCIWVVLAGLALPLVPGALSTPGAGLAAMSCVAGLALTVLFVILAGPPAVAWALVGCAALGTLADAEAGQLAWIDGRKVATRSCLEQQRRAGGDDPSRDPFGHLATAVGVELRAAQSPERAGVEQHERVAHGRRLACRMRRVSSRSGCGPAQRRLTNVSSACAWARSCASSSRSFASAPRITSSASDGASAPRRVRNGSSAAASAGVSVIECRG